MTSASRFEHPHAALKGNAPPIDAVIHPDLEVARTIERLMDVPGAVDGGIKVVGVHLEPGSRLAGVQLSDLPSLLNENGHLIAALVRDDQLIIQTGSNHLRPRALVHFFSKEKHLYKHLSIFGKHVSLVEQVLIGGGGNIGYRLAKHLEALSFNIAMGNKYAVITRINYEKSM